MAAIGTVWGLGTWTDDIWAENTWDAAAEIVDDTYLATANLIIVFKEEQVNLKAE